MKLAEMTYSRLQAASDEEVRIAWLRLSQWFGAAQNKGKAVENIVNAAAFVADEYKRRGWEIDSSKPLAQAVASLQRHKGMAFSVAQALDSLPAEVVLVKDFASLVGSAVSKEKPRDIDVLIRARRDDAGENFLVQKDNILLPLRNALDPDKLQKLHWIDNPQGPHADHVPLYSLVLRRESLEKQIVKALEPGDRFPPEKPLMAGVTEFFSTKELWPWCEKKIEEGAKLAGEIKFDGFRCIISLKDGEVSAWFEDSGEDRAEHLPQIVKAVKESGYKSLILDGEMLAVDHRGRIIPRTQLLEMLSGDPAFEPYYVAFDCLNLDEDISGRPLGERQAILAAVVDDLKSPHIKLSQARKFETEKELEIVGRWAASKPTSEGLMVKDLTKPYHPGGSDDWGKWKTTFEIKVQVLEVQEKKNGYSYLCGLQEAPKIADQKQVHPSGMLVLGSTFVSQYKASVGDVLNVRIEELLILNKSKDEVHISWGKPTVVGPDSSRDAYTVAQAVDLARRGHVLKVEVGKEDVPAWGKEGAQIAFVAASPNESERSRREPMVAPSGETFNKLYLEPAGLKKEDVAILYLVPQVLYEKGQPRAPSELEVEAWTGHLMQKLYEINPRVIVALGKQAGAALDGLADCTMPHPAAVHRHGDSGEVARKIKQVMAKVQETAKQDDGQDTRSDIAAREYHRAWWQMVPASGKGRFVLQAHWRGLSEEETKLSHEDLLKTDHSVHCDLRFEIDKGRLWGFTVFEGSTKDIRDKGQGEARILHLPPSDSLQGAFKLQQPHQWLAIAAEKPFISEPGGVGSTAHKFSKFFQLDAGTYDFSFARLHGREVFLHGEKLKGRLLMQYMPASEGRVWVISRPESQEPYTASHKLEDVIDELRDKGQEKLVWSSLPGQSPKIINIQRCPFKKQRYAAILKADEEKRLVFGVISEPDTVDLQGDVLSREEIARMARNFVEYVREFRDRHTNKKVKVEIVRSEIAEKDQMMYGQRVLAGSWLLCVRVLDDEVWGKIKAGIYRAFSIGGRGVRIERVRPENKRSA
jgi:uracil-DNA glycosylase family 4